jgi:hypothetical protein
MDENYKKLLEQFYNTAQLILAKNGYVTPLYVLIKDNSVMPVIQENYTDINKYAEVVTQIASDQSSDAVILICEQYMVMGRKESKNMQDYISGQKKVSEHPNAKPYLTGCFMTAEGDHDSMIAEIHIEPSKGTRYIFEPEWIKDSQNIYLLPWRIQ